jgi:predicted GNAT superfamily acetyltransferase
LLQREIARADGIERIAWAFDPLQAGNAHFNLARLGASAGVYVENMYGLRTDALNAGVPTDRLIAEWETSDVPAAAIAADAVATLPRVIQLERGRGDDPPGSLLEPRAIDDVAIFNAAHLFLEVPSDIAHLRREAPALAERWRSVVGQAFRTAFAAGYRAIHFVRDDTSGQRRSFYVLQRL